MMAKNFKWDGRWDVEVVSGIRIHDKLDRSAFLMGIVNHVSVCFMRPCPIIFLADQD